MQSHAQQLSCLHVGCREWHLRPNASTDGVVITWYTCFCALDPGSAFFWVQNLVKMQETKF
jgi:hypothetical protein